LAPEQTDDVFSPPDWHPSDHPEMPFFVGHGRAPAVWACAYCHLPDGSGRPENAPIAGLPADYIRRQLAAFRSGQRRSPGGAADFPSVHMRDAAVAATDLEIAIAAGYFSSLSLPAKVSVREAERIPRVVADSYLYAVVGGEATEPLAGRIVETPEDFSRHELRDSRLHYVAYVPVGSVAAGRRLAFAGPAGTATACAVCHGPSLRGGPVAPPLAGRLATYLFRQMLAFQRGDRKGPDAAPMQPVVAPLAESDMVALAAYLASCPP